MLPTLFRDAWLSKYIISLRLSTSRESFLPGQYGTVTSGYSLFKLLILHDRDSQGADCCGVSGAINVMLWKLSPASYPSIVQTLERRSTEQ